MDSGKRIINNYKKIGAKEKNRICEKTLKCCRYSGNVYNFKALQRLAGEPAVSQNRFYSWEPISNTIFYNAFDLR